MLEKSRLGDLLCCSRLNKPSLAFIFSSASNLTTESSSFDTHGSTHVILQLLTSGPHSLHKDISINQ